MNEKIERWFDEIADLGSCLNESKHTKDEVDDVLSDIESSGQKKEFFNFFMEQLINRDGEGWYFDEILYVAKELGFKITWK